MKTTLNEQPESQVKLTIVADEEQLTRAKKAAIEKFRPQVNVSGFRPGHAPDKIVEQQAAGNVQQEVIDIVVADAYMDAVEEKQLRILGRPEISVTKFAPYTELEFEAVVEVMPEFKLPDYKKISVPFEEPSIDTEEVNQVLENLRFRTAESKEVKRAAKDGDKVWIDFKGVRADDGSEVGGASGEDYPLILGSNTFIKGFEPKLVGVKPGEEKTFTVTFPKDYNVQALQNEKVKFTVTVKKVEEVNKPKLDDEFAKQAGPFNDLKSLKSDVKAQLLQEKIERARSDHRQKVVEKLVEKTKLEAPKQMLERVREQLEQEMQQNLQYRGLTMEQYAEQQGYSSVEEFKKKELDPQSVKRAKSSLILTEVAEAEQIKVPREALDERLAALKQQYQDPQLQEELDKPEARRELAAQLLTEKTIEKLVEYAS